MTDVVWGTNEKPVTSQRLATLIEQNFPGDGLLYVGYPVLAGADDVSSVDDLWVSPQKGVVMFQLLEGAEAEGFEAKQDDYANKLETRLRLHAPLMAGRTLLASPRVVTFAPIAGKDVVDGGYPIASNEQNLLAILNAIHWDNPELFGLTHSVIQSISSIRKGGRRRRPIKEDSRGAILKSLEDSIANLDSLQSRAVIETVDPPEKGISAGKIMLEDLPAEDLAELRRLLNG